MTRPAQAFLHCRKRYPEILRNVFLRNLSQVAQFHHRSCLLWKIQQRTFQQALKILLTESFGRIECQGIKHLCFCLVIKDSFIWEWETRKRFLVKDNRLMPSYPASAHIATNAIKPGIKTFRSMQIREVRPCLEQCLLHDVFSSINRNVIPSCDGEQARASS